MTADVRCPTCRRLLARRLDDGSLEVRQGGRHRVVVREGEVTCSRCPIVVRVGNGRRIAIRREVT